MYFTSKFVPALGTIFCPTFYPIFIPTFGTTLIELVPTFGKTFVGGLTLLYILVFGSEAVKLYLNEKDES